MNQEHSQRCQCVECVKAANLMFADHIHTYAKAMDCEPTDALLQYMVFASQHLAEIAYDVTVRMHISMMDHIMDEITSEDFIKELHTYRKALSERFDVKYGFIPTH